MACPLSEICNTSTYTGRVECFDNLMLVHVFRSSSLAQKVLVLAFVLVLLFGTNLEVFAAVLHKIGFEQLSKPE